VQKRGEKGIRYTEMMRCDKRKKNEKASEMLDGLGTAS
jgi:hypothetical protein